MRDDEQTTDSRLLSDPVRPLTQALLLVLIINFIIFTVLFINSFFSFNIIILLSQILDSAISALSPGYDHGTRLRVLLPLMQVAVLYFAVLVAVLRFIDSSSRFSTDGDRILFIVVILSLLFVSVSAFLAVVSTLRIFTKEVFIGALLCMGVAFLLSFLTPILGVVGEIREGEQQETDKESRPTGSQPVEDNDDSGDERAQMAHALGWGCCAGDKQHPEQ